MKRRSFLAALPAAAAAAPLLVRETAGTDGAEPGERIYAAAGEMRADGCALAY